jgi:FAD:protein FMN transferase
MADAPVLLALEAMATRFELVLHGDSRPALRAAGEEALAEIVRLDRLLSAYRDDSDIGRLNRLGTHAPVRVTAETCRVLRDCLTLSRTCDGAFDVTVGPLVRAWRSAGARGERPAADTLAEARACVGADHVRVDEQALTVAFAHPGMAVDLGAAGKGYAVDQAVAALREAGVSSALLHGGTSSIHAIGAPPGADAWPIRRQGASDIVLLRDAALSVSAGHGRAFEANGALLYGHVLDPRTGEPVPHTRAAGVTGPSSFLCDALSTVALVRGADWLPDLRQHWPGYDGWVTQAP